MAIKMHMEVVMVGIITFALAKGILGRTAAIVNAVYQALVLEGFQRPVNGNPVCRMHALLKIG